MILLHLNAIGQGTTATTELELNGLVYRVYKGDEDDYNELKQYLNTDTIIYWCIVDEEFMWNTCKHSLRCMYNAYTEN